MASGHGLHFTLDSMWLSEALTHPSSAIASQCSRCNFGWLAKWRFLRPPGMNVLWSSRAGLGGGQFLVLPQHGGSKVSTIPYTEKGG